MSTSNSWRILLGILLVLGFAVLLVCSYGGEIARDVFLSRQTLVPHPTAEVISAKCTRHYLLVSSCSIEYDDPAIVKPADKVQVKSELSYLMFGSVKGEQVVLLRPLKGQGITSSTGMAHLTNRIVTLLLLAGFCTVVPLFMAFKLLRGQGAAAPVDRSLTSDSVDAAIAKRLLETQQTASTAAAPYAPPAYQAAVQPRATFGQRRFSR